MLDQLASIAAVTVMAGAAYGLGRPILRGLGVGQEDRLSTVVWEDLLPEIREALLRSIDGAGMEEGVARLRAGAPGPFGTQARGADAGPEASWEAAAAPPGGTSTAEAYALAGGRERSPVFPLDAERIVDALLLAEIIEAPAPGRRRA